MDPMGYLCTMRGDFALSNSFYMLVEHLKESYELTLNKDYCNHILCESLSGFSCHETPICEIKLIDKDLDIFINKENKNIELFGKKHIEYTIGLRTDEGIRVLDQWFNKWTSFFEK